MKKVLFVIVLVMAALVVNAQTTANTAQAKPATTVVKIADLPKAIAENVAKDYAGFTIKDATCTTTDNVLTYDVVIVKDNTSHTLVYDKDGKFIKMKPMAQEMK
jgi:hypothetical protein